MAFKTNATNNNNNSDENKKADAWINLRAVKNKEGTEFPLQGIPKKGIPLELESGGLSQALIEQAKANDGKLTITLVADINVVAETPDASSFGEF